MIARRLGLTRQSVQRVVADLVAGGMAALVPNPAHERSPLVTITDSGRRTLAKLFSASNAERTALLKAAGVSADDLLAARATLRALLAAFQR